MCIVLMLKHFNIFISSSKILNESRSEITLLYLSTFIVTKGRFTFYSFLYWIKLFFLWFDISYDITYIWNLRIYSVLIPRKLFKREKKAIPCIFFLIHVKHWPIDNETLNVYNCWVYACRFPVLNIYYMDII